MKKRGWWILSGVLLFFLASLTVFIVAIFFLLSRSDNLEYTGADVAVVEIEGTIMEAKDTLETLEKVEKNKSIKAVVLRIDSPGGAVGPSQEIYEAVKKLKLKKKVVVSMGSVAASGGYYIAVASDKILAMPGTITGSIGVLMDHVNIEGFLGIFKVKAEILKAGARKDIGSSLRPMTEEERAFLQSLLGNMHAQFKRAVQEGRGFTDDQINALADGRVFTGEQALQEKLVDQLGGLRDAIKVAGELAGIKGEPDVSYPGRKKKSFVELLLTEDAETTLLKMFYHLKQRQFLYLMKGDAV
ncbi:MAG: signal peptide peptidase SppA [Deltaproteobacteria bacterium]|nr:signal peptide peptidase SppA [Deltaproteobacteria bacterium]